MGWWMQNAAGESFAAGGELCWGDGPADAIGVALAEVAREFTKQFGRVPTRDEIQAGLLFGLHGYEETVEPERIALGGRLVFEETTSPLYRSNDGRLAIERVRETVPHGFEVVDEQDRQAALPSDRRGPLFTLRHEIADAFVAGWDYARFVDARAKEE